MGSFYTNIQVRSEDYQGVIDSLRNANGFPVYISKRPSNGWISVYPQGTEAQDQPLLQRMVKSISRYLDTGAFGLLVHDSDVFWYVLSKSGEILDVYDSDPGYFSGSDRPPSGGNLVAVLPYCVNGTTIEQLSDLLQSRRERSADVTDPSALMKALSENNMQAMQAMLNQDDVFRGDSLARKFGERLGLPAGRASMGYNHLRQGEGRSSAIIHIKDPDQASDKSAAKEGPPHLVAESSLDGLNPLALRINSTSLDARAKTTADLSRESGQDLAWIGTIANRGGYSQGLSLTLQGELLNQGALKDIVAFVSKGPNGSPTEADYEPADPEDESYWPYLAKFKSANEGVWAAELPEFAYETRIVVQLCCTLSAGENGSIGLAVKPIDSQGLSDANFTINLRVIEPKPRLKLIVSEPCKYKIGPYEITVPGYYETSVRTAEELGPFNVLGSTGLVAQLNAIKNSQFQVSVTIVKADKHAGGADIQELLGNLRSKRKMRKFQSSPVVSAVIGGINFKYSHCHCEDMKWYGLIASGQHANNLVLFSAQKKGSEPLDEFEVILKSFSTTNE